MLTASSIWRLGQVDLARLAPLGEGNLIGHLGIRFTAAGERWIEALMPVGPRVHQPFGVLHGGASVVLAETVASVGAQLTIDPEWQSVAGLEINANHIRPMREGELVARGTCEHLGRTTQVWSVRLQAAEDESLVCLSRVTIAVISR